MIECVSVNHACGFKALSTPTHLYITYNVILSGCDFRNTRPDRRGVSLRGYALLHADMDIILRFHFCNFKTNFCKR